ncbi:MAG: tetratricopeptide repeat protein, partial [Candidatus Bathyarchaeota archaeon]
MSTEQGQLLGTPEYMSPEQIEHDSEDIDTRTDVYSLGVLLYVLLTGLLPFDSRKLREGGIEHIRQIIHETDPKTPKSRLLKLGDEATAIAYNRRMEINTLAKHLGKELEWIPLKAMRKDRSERYRSASELADDIENYQKGSPLIAGPPSTVYQLKKYVRQHSAFFTGITVVLLVLFAGIVVSTLLAIGKARAHAQAQAVSDFLRLSVLESLDPFKVGGRQITIRSVLDTASKDLHDNFKGTPMAEAQIRHTIGFAYWSLGLYEQHELHYKRAIDICREQLGDEDPTTLTWVKEKGWGYFHNSRYEEAETLFSEAMVGMQRKLGLEDERTMHSMGALAMVFSMQGRFQEAEMLFTPVLEAARRMGIEEYFLGGIGWAYHLQGRYMEAENPSARALEYYRQQQGNTAYITLQLMRNLGELYRDMGRYEEAEKLLHESVKGWLNVWGAEHPEALWTTMDLGWLCCSQGRYDEAQSFFDKTLETAHQAIGDEHFVTAQSMHGLGTVYLRQGQYDQAELILNRAWDVLCRLLSKESWAALSVKNTLGKLNAAQGHYHKAEEIYLETLDSRKHKLGEDHPHTLESKNDLAMLYKEQG